MSDVAECPYCGHENEMTGLLADLDDSNKTDWECENEECEEEFEVLVEFEPSFSTGKIEYKECDKCGDTVRSFFEKGRVFPFPQHIEADVLCKGCWRKGVSEEMEDAQ